MKIGFVGCGGISEAVIRGLVAHSGYPAPLFVSKRSEFRSSRLAAEFDNIEVVADNQEIVDRADLVFISVLPEQARPLLAELNFRDGQIVASMVAAIPLEELERLIEADVALHRLIPMPPIEIGLGPIPICPPNPELETLLGRVGTPVAFENEELISSFTCVSSSMACYFEMVAQLAKWTESQGVPAEVATTYTTSLMGALAGLVKNSDAATLQEMSEECLTRGGLNEQVLNELRDEKWFETYLARFDNIRDRIRTM